MKKAVKCISVIIKLNVILPRSSLLTIHKSFIRPHLDYGDVIYNKPNNNRLSEKTLIVILVATEIYIVEQKPVNFYKA